MNVGVPKETYPGERLVALIPDSLPGLIKAGLTVLVEAGAGAAAGFPDEAYQAKGALLSARRPDLFSSAQIIVQVRTIGANPQAGRLDLDLVHQGQTVIGFGESLTNPGAAKELADRGVNFLVMELMPRITRAQSMDAMSSMANIAGYKAVLLAAGTLPRMFPMLMTAAGTVAPARVFVIGAGVAGLQAIATARRLGAVVKGYDVRPVVKEQVESLGAKFVELPLEARDAQAAGGYAKAMDEAFYQKQRELMTKVVAESDVVITTALVPGKKSPVLVTGEMLKGMQPGSVVIDLAAERGGNCDVTKADETVVHHGVTVLGPTNLVSTVPFHASQMYAKNMATFLAHLVKNGELKLNLEDEITRETLISHNGKVVHARIAELLGVAPSQGRTA